MRLSLCSNGIDNMQSMLIMGLGQLKYVVSGIVGVCIFLFRTKGGVGSNIGATIIFHLSTHFKPEPLVRT